MKAIAAIRRFWVQDTGAIAIEFGLVISALIMILTGCFEAGRYILLNQKLDRASSSVADLVSQSNTMTADMLDDIYFAAGQQTLPFDLTGSGRVIVSSVYRSGADPAVVAWQCQGGGAYSSGSSVIGAEGATAAMPNETEDEESLFVGVGENVIVAEVLYDYEPFIFQGIFQPKVFRHSTYTRPRASLLVNDPGC